MPAPASPTPPIIVLVEPQLGENIGMCARALLNCGLDRLRLVNPRDGWPSDAARAAAADADRVIEQARCFDSIDDALADCHHVVAATARSRRLRIPVHDLDATVADIVTHPAETTTAVLFGPEASGLDNDALSRADRLLCFPTNPDFPSLNLAQAVLLFAWQWRMSTVAAAGPDTPPAEPLSASAPRRDLAIFLERLETALDAADFFLTPELRPDTLRNLRSLFTRSRLSDDELRLLHGVLTALTRE